MTNPSLRILKAKYQLLPNLYAACQLEAEQLSEEGMQVFVGVKAPRDTQIAIGAKLFVEPLSLPGSQTDPALPYEQLTSQVLKHEAQTDGTILHICSGVKRQCFEERRKQPRKPCQFMMGLGDLRFKVVDAHLEGLQLNLQSEQKLSTLFVNRSYTLTATLNQSVYSFPGDIKHIQYDWKTFVHRIGFALKPLDTEHQTALNMLIDPSYKIDLGQSTVNAATGKISSV